MKPMIRKGMTDIGRTARVLRKRIDIVLYNKIRHIIDSLGHDDFKRKKILAHETHFEA